ncbi:MAG: hypothetical protein ACYC63_04900 [Armatimonadota bacterium]
MADLKSVFGLDESNKMTLTPSNVPVGSRFVSIKNKLYEVTDWQQDGSGHDVVYLLQAKEGTEDMAGAQTTKYDRDPLTVFLVSTPDEAAPAADDADLGDDLNDIEETPGTGDADDFEPPAAESGEEEEAVREEAEAPAVGEELAAAIITEDEFEGVEAPAVDEFDRIPESVAPVVEAEMPTDTPPTKKMTWDGNAGNGMGDLVFLSAKRCMSITEIAKECIDKKIYTEMTTACGNVRRWVRKNIKLGYGLMFVGDPDGSDLSKCLVQLTHDGVTPFVPPVEEAALVVLGVDPTAAAVRKILGFHTPGDLPAPLSQMLAGLTDSDMGLSAGQIKGISMIAMGLAFYAGGNA